MRFLETVGQLGYTTYCRAAAGRSLVSGDELPAWEDLQPETRAAWCKAADAVATYTDQLRREVSFFEVDAGYCIDPVSCRVGVETIEADSSGAVRRVIRAGGEIDLPRGAYVRRLQLLVGAGTETLVYPFQVTATVSDQGPQHVAGEEAHTGKDD